MSTSSAAVAEIFSGVDETAAFAADSNHCCRSAFLSPPQSAEELIVFFQELRERLRSASASEFHHLSREATALYQHALHLQGNAQRCHSRIVSLARGLKNNRTTTHRTGPTSPSHNTPPSAIRVSDLKLQCQQLELNASSARPDHERPDIGSAAHAWRFKIVAACDEIDDVVSSIPLLLDDLLSSLETKWKEKKTLYQQSLYQLEDEEAAANAAYEQTKFEVASMRSRLKNLPKNDPGLQGQKAAFREKLAARRHAEDRLHQVESSLTRARAKLTRSERQAQKDPVGILRDEKRLQHWGKRIKEAQKEMEGEAVPEVATTEYPEEQESLMSFMRRTL